MMNYVSKIKLQKKKYSLKKLVILVENRTVYRSKLVSFGLGLQAAVKEKMGE